VHFHQDIGVLLLIGISYAPPPRSFYTTSANPCETVPETYPRVRRLIYIIAISIMSLGISLSCVWVFQCQPFLSNFVWSIEPTWCADIFIARYGMYLYLKFVLLSRLRLKQLPVWVAASVIFDFVLAYIPYMLMRQLILDAHKRNVLMVVFSAILLGSIAWYEFFSTPYRCMMRYLESIGYLTSDKSHRNLRYLDGFNWLIRV
jgi:hypothetical protein